MDNFTKFCAEKFLRIWRTAASGCPRTGWQACATKTFYDLRLSQRLLSNCFESFYTWWYRRLAVAEGVGLKPALTDSSIGFGVSRRFMGDSLA